MLAMFDDISRRSLIYIYIYIIRAGIFANIISVSDMSLFWKFVFCCYSCFAFIYSIRAHRGLLLRHVIQLSEQWVAGAIYWVENFGLWGMQICMCVCVI